MVFKHICFAPPPGSVTVLIVVNSICLMCTLFGVILTQYKAQFYVESNVTKGLYYAATAFFYASFFLCMAHICFGFMQRKHLRKVSADYPEIDLRTGQKGKYLLAVFVFSILATAGGFGCGGFGIHYMQTRKVTTLQWTLDTPVDLDADGNLLQLSIEQTVQHQPVTWKNVQDRLGCCSWSNVTDQYATGYCCNNRDHQCPLEAAVPCKQPWLDEMENFNFQVCAVLLVVGAAQMLSFIATLQLRFCSRSSLYKYQAYGGSLSEKHKREKAIAEAAKKAAAEKEALAAKEAEENDGLDLQERDTEAAEKQPLTGAKIA